MRDLTIQWVKQDKVVVLSHLRRVLALPKSGLPPGMERDSSATQDIPLFLENFIKFLANGNGYIDIFTAFPTASQSRIASNAGARNAIAADWANSPRPVRLLRETAKRPVQVRRQAPLDGHYERPNGWPLSSPGSCIPPPCERAVYGNWPWAFGLGGLGSSRGGAGGRGR